MTIFVALVGLAALGGIAGCAIAYRRWRQEAREVARIRGMFSRYVAPAVVDVLLARKDERLFTGRAVNATVLVCRIRNFSHFIEDLSPEETLRYLNEFYGLAGTAIQRHRGMIDAFLGDGIVAVFGVPLDNPMQEDDAVRAALAIVRHVVAMRERWASQNRKPFTVGIGINSGEVIAGDAGFRDRREFTVVGPEATFAHRLQEAAFALNAYIVASRTTCEPLTDEYALVPVSGVPLPGVRRLLDAFVVRGRKRGAERFTVPVDALVETTIEPGEPETAPTAGAILPATTAAAATSPPPSAPSAPPPVARPRRATATPDLGLPELRHGWTFPDHDAEAIFPDPPPPRATYEDRSGPPLDL
ncbi:MAG TPA: adenylate/guanylate cyclase domain-containing protein [Candidatus Limnocylindria bacterium]|jgi:class 3 adenylate cyclase|nr:adenylate/guanylate cyclase domain-containing protein [Candidatus Limnocylindria bacterium]